MILLQCPHYRDVCEGMVYMSGMGFVHRYGFTNTNCQLCDSLAS